MNLENPRTRRLLVATSIVSAIVLLIAAGTLWYLTRAPAPPRVVTPTPLAIGSPPPIDLTPPASLEELGARYPKIATLLQDPALASAYKEFMLVYQQGGLSAAESLARERGLLSKNREVRITLVLDSPASVPAVKAELERLGVIIEGTYQELIDIAVPLALVEQYAQSDEPGKVFSQLSGMEHVAKLRLPMPNRPESHLWPSEAVTQTGALAWHKAGYTGKGIKIGVIDLGFQGYKDLLGKTLPPADKVIAKSFVSGQTVDQSDEVHGTACAEIIHAMAPDAQLYLAYYNGNLTGLGQAAEWLIEQKVNIISHSASGLLGPMDGTGPQAQLVDQVTAQGILWVNASGNSATEHYRFTFNDKKGNGRHTFPDGSQALLYNPPSEDARIILNWNDWAGNATEDYDLYLYDENGKVVASSEDTQQGQPKDIPAEAIRINRPTRKTYYIVIIAKNITQPAVFDLYAHNGRLGYHSAEHSLGTPADARGALSVGAISWRDHKLETFSSRGPTNDGRLKPELVAPDRVTTRAYRGEIFPGTSASTPHVAGAAALVMSRFPQMKTAQVRAFLESSAVDMGPAGPDTAYGYGRLQLPPPTQAQPPAQLKTPVVIVTARPVVEVPPEATEQISDRAAMGVLAGLSLLVCCGAVGVLGGLVMLVFSARPRPRPAPAVPMPPWSPQPQWPSPAVAPYAPGAMVLTLASLSGQRYTLRTGKITVGRSPENDLYLDDSQVSRHHAEIVWDGIRCFVTDLNSRNGTFVNGRRLMPNLPQMLHPGDRVSFGTASVWTVTVG